MQPNDNNIVFNEYGINLLGFIEYILKLLHIDQLTITGVTNFLGVAWDIFSILAFLISGLFIFGIIYAYLRAEEYYELASHNLDLAHQAWQDIHGGRQENQRWRDVQLHVASERPNDWKLAIIEADIMLGDGLKEKGYAGASIGEQLKGLSPQQFPSVQDAWDAHRIRNRIAHEGSDYVLTQSAAGEAVVKYERALRELGVI